MLPSTRAKPAVVQPSSLRNSPIRSRQADDVIKRLRIRIEEVKALEPKTVPYMDEKVRAIASKIRNTILEVFGENSPEYREHAHHQISGGRPMRMVGYGEDPRYYEAERQQDFAEGIPRTITMLEGLIGTVQERTDSARVDVPQIIVETPVSKDEVFIVHGRREGPREAVARFITKLGLKPIILHEQASEGRTVIEKIEGHSSVGYAVVLLTGDDRGGLSDDDPSTYLLRARQNVILELGYFLGNWAGGTSAFCTRKASGFHLTIKGSFTCLSMPRALGASCSRER